MRLLVGVLGCLWVAWVHAEAVLHAATGLAFPDEIAGLRREGVEDLEGRHPGLGFAYKYDGGPGWYATIYVYTLGIFEVPTAINEPTMARVHEQSIGDIFKGAQQHDEKVDGPRPTDLKLQTEQGEVAALFDGFTVRSPTSGPRETFLCLWPARGHFLKTRFTAPGGSGDSAVKRARTFNESVIRFTTVPYAGKRAVGIALGQSKGSPEDIIWVAYGLGLNTWIENKQLKPSLPLGAYRPTFDAELYAREQQLVVWRKLKEKGLPPLPYMDAVLAVADAGFLREYVWQFHRRRDWREPPNLRSAEFLAWQASHLKDHAPQTGAGVIVQPVIEK
jgi:hypothetical protein